VHDIFSRAGIAPERVEFADQGSHGEYLSNYREIDIVLDTLPYNGHTTSLDSWWMGVPVLSLIGNTMAGRACVCYTRNLDLSEWAVNDVGSYVDAATRFSRDLGALSRLRAELRVRVEQSPLNDFPRFARNMEAAYQGMWQRWCSGVSPGAGT
jgi:predicted O-linked N-acetylglucosamine transferase (SPINDLY family)